MSFLRVLRRGGAGPFRICQKERGSTRERKRSQAIIANKIHDYHSPCPLVLCAAVSCVCFCVLVAVSLWFGMMQLYTTLIFFKSPGFGEILVDEKVNVN